MFKGTFSGVKFYADYESVIIQNLLYFFIFFLNMLGPMGKYHQSTPQYYKLGVKKNKNKNPY